MSKQKTIYDLELFQKTDIDNHTRYERVPGGWIVSKYITRGVAHAEFMSTTFVPYNKEFKDPIKFNVPKHRREEIEGVIKDIEFHLKQLKNRRDTVLDMNKEEETIQYETALSILKSNTK